MTVTTYEYHQKYIFEIGEILIFGGEKLQCGLMFIQNGMSHFIPLGN